MADLRELGLHIRQTASVWYKVGTVPGISPPTPDVTNVFIYSQKSGRGWLLFYRTEKNGSILAIRNGYRIERKRNTWTASEGNGGIATYKAMAAYAAKLAKQKSIKVVLIPDRTNCSAED